MASNFLSKVYEDIAENQKGMQVRTSVHLKKIDEYLFSKSCPKFTNHDIEILFNGIPEKNIMGLYGLAGIKGFISGLKKSSYYALELIFKAMHEGVNKQMVFKYFVDADQDDFRHIHLATHITEDVSKTALELCCILKQNRPYLKQDDYILSEEAKKLFKKHWEFKNKNKRKDNKAKKTSVAQENPLALIESIPQQKQSDPFRETGMKGKKYDVSISTNLENLEFMDIQIMLEEEEYLIDSFVDPLDIWKLKKDSFETRQKIAFKQYMTYVIETPISQVPRQYISEKIKYIHPESKEFSPSILIEKFHSNLSDDEKLGYGKTIPSYFNQNWEKNMVKYFFSNLMDVEHSISKIKENFEQSEKIRNEANIGYSLRTKMKNSMKNLSARVEPLKEKYEHCEKLRNIIIFLQQNSQFTKLSNTILLNTEQGKIENIPLIFSKYQNIIELYKNKPILGMIIAEIQQNMIYAKVKQLNKTLNTFHLKEAKTLMGLFPDRKCALREYIVPKMVNFILEELEFKNQALQNLQKELKKYEILNFKEIIKSSSSTLNDIDEGDLLQQFLNEHEKKELNFKIRCEKFGSEVEQKLTSLYEIMENWRIELNLHFPEKDLLILGMIEWCSSVTKEINDEISGEKEDIEVKEECVKIVCKMLLMTEKYAVNKEELERIEKLKENNFDLYRKLVYANISINSRFSPCPIKRDADHNYYNDILVAIMENAMKGCKSLQMYPSVVSSPNSSYYEESFYEFVCTCFQIDDSLLGKLPEILTYASVVNSCLDDKFLNPFYYQLRKYENLKSKLSERMKKKSKRIKQFLYSYLKIQYCSLVSKNKYTQFANPLLDILNEHIFLISEYSVNNYKGLTRFFMESLLNELSKFPKEKELLNDEAKLKGFYDQLLIVRSLTNKIMSSRIKERWNQILKDKVSKADEERVEVEILKLRHRNSITYQALAEY